MAGNGSRRRSGCFNCRKRKHLCDEEKPICRRCQKIGADCIFPGATPALKFVVATPTNHYTIPVRSLENRASFLNLSPLELKTIYTKFQPDDEGDSALQGLPLSVTAPNESQALVLTPRATLSFLTNHVPGGLRSTEAALIQYYFDVISSSRVYVQTRRNGFRTSVIPRVLSQRGSLFYAVLALSSAEWSHDIVADGRDYHALSTHYKVRALRELQHTLLDSQSAESNLLTCVLLASLEISQGSQPAWLRHLQGALALVYNFGEAMEPSVAQFALRYFRFRYILLETTKPTADVHFAGEPSRSYLDDLARVESSISTLQDNRGLIDERIGCSMELVDIINEICSPSQVTGGNSDTLSEDDLYRKGQGIENRIAQLSICDPGTTDEYLLKSAKSFKTAAQIYLRLACYNTPITSPIIEELHQVLLSCLSDIIVERQARRSFPMWPLFLAGCLSSSDEHRKIVLDYFSLLDSKWPISNISAVWNALRIVWHTRDMMSSSGSRSHQDWRHIIHKFGWKLSLS